MALGPFVQTDQIVENNLRTIVYGKHWRLGQKPCDIGSKRAYYHSSIATAETIGEGSEQRRLLVFAKLSYFTVLSLESDSYADSKDFIRRSSFFILVSEM